MNPHVICHLTMTLSTHDIYFICKIYWLKIRCYNKALTLSYILLAFQSSCPRKPLSIIMLNKDTHTYIQQRLVKYSKELFLFNDIKCALQLLSDLIQRPWIWNRNLAITYDLHFVIKLTNHVECDFSPIYLTMFKVTAILHYQSSQQTKQTNGQYFGFEQFNGC